MSLLGLKEIKEGDQCYVFGCTGHMELVSTVSATRDRDGAPTHSVDKLVCDKCGEEIDDEDS
jgi:hypothetical protein